MASAETLRTQYVDDLKKQKKLLNDILNTNGDESNIHDSFETMIDKVLETKGKEVLPYYNFSRCESPEMQEIIKTINFSNQESLGGCFAYWQTPDLSTVNTINAKTLDKFVYGQGLRDSVFKITLGEKFILKNCTSLNYFLSGAGSDDAANKIELIHDAVPKQTVLNPVSMDNLVSNVSFDRDIDNPVEKFKSIVDFFKKVTFTEVTSLNNFLYDTHFNSAYLDEFNELIGELIDLIPLKKVKAMNNIMLDVNFNRGAKFYPRKHQVLEELEVMDRWFGYFSRISSVDLSNWEFKKVNRITDIFDNHSGNEYVEYIHMGYNNEPSLNKIDDCWSNLQALHTIDFSGWNFGGFTQFYRNWYTPPENLVNMFWGYNHGKAYNYKQSNYGSYTFDCGGMRSLSKECIVDLFNKLYDLNISYGVYDEEGNPGEGVLYTQAIKLHANVKAKLTPEEIAIVTNKGWTLL